MAGGNSYFEYTADSGSVFGVLLDKTNALAMGFTPYSDASPRQPLPKGMKMRGVYCVHPTTGAKRFLPVPDLASAFWTGATNTVTLTNYVVQPSTQVAFTIVGQRGEKAPPRRHAVDTGLLG